MIICESIPCGHRQVKVVLIAALASILDSDSDNIARPANTVISGWASVGENDFATTEWTWRTLTHPERTNSDSEGAIGAIYSAGSQSTSRVWVDSGFAIVAMEWTELV
jgi:hypothetical protein